ncbi:unnamed protein product [Didymodactylos carnosus]|uniref:Uncharacterized protein n=1 Tax=Didymodactylos carnosus TaxID=1234261 RepID=A0A815UBH4_9BILA|nr:unnamed protein product [Didymodactylos carnosus]CAF4377022.1 unnamed protein product [Didymodactylos carnosus]
MLIDQLELLETMTPGAFLEFRDYVTPASGFQSLQFRIIENKLGLTDKSRSVYKMNHFTDQMFTRRVQAEELKKSMEEKSLLMLLEKWLENIYDSITSLDFLNEYKLGVERFIDHEVEEYLPKFKNSMPIIHRPDQSMSSLVLAPYQKPPTPTPQSHPAQSNMVDHLSPTFTLTFTLGIVLYAILILNMMKNVGYALFH